MLFSSVIFLLIFFQYFRKNIFCINYSYTCILCFVCFRPSNKNKYNGFVLKANMLLNLVNKEDELNSKYDDRKI